MGLTIGLWSLALPGLLFSARQIPSREQARSGPVEVEIQAADGFLLAARLYEAGSEGPGVLLLHQGNRQGSETGYETLAAMLSERGIHALVLDFRGYGGSVDERFTGENWGEAHAFFEGDVEAALRFLSRRTRIDGQRIGLVGASIGGRQAALAARKHSEVRALCLLSANLMPSVSSTLDGLADLPLLCIAAEQDPHARAAEAAREAFALSKNAASQFVIHKGTWHGVPLFDHDPGLEALIAGWMARLLERTQPNRIDSADTSSDE